MIAEVAPLVPAAGAAASFLIAFTLIAMAFVLWGLRKAYISTFGALLSQLARLTGHIWIVGGKLTDAIEATNHYVESRIADAALSVDATAAKFWHAGEWLTKLTADTIKYLADETYHAFKLVRDHTIPHAVATATTPIRHGLGALNSRALALEQKALGQVHKAIAALRAQIAAASAVAHSAIGAAEAGLYGRLAHDRRVLERELAALRDFTYGRLTKRISRTEKLAAGAALAMLAVRTLERTWGFLKCSNVRKAGKATCRMDSSLLDSLLLDTLAIASLLSVVEFAKGLQAVEHEVVGVMLKGVRETRDLDGL